MLLPFIIPVAVEGPPESPEAGPPRRPTPVVWALIGVWLALFLGERLALLGLDHGWSWLPRWLAQDVPNLSATWKLYPVPSGLFEPWQLWACALYHDGWLQLALDLLFAVVFGRALERWLGSGVFLLALLLMTLAAGGAWLATALAANASAPALFGASGLIAAMLGLAWGLFARQQVRALVGYWLFHLITYRPQRSAVRWWVVAYLALDLLRAWFTGAHLDIAAMAAGVLAGFLLGLGMRWLMRRTLLA